VQLATPPTMHELQLTQTIDAPVERVWQACASLRGLSAWQADEASGTLEAGKTIELGWPALGVQLELEVEALSERERIVLAADHARLELLLAPGRVTLIHSGVGSGDELEGVASSWRMSLSILAHYCERHFGHRRFVRWLTRPAPTSAETAHVFFTDESALGNWLGRGGGIGDVGSSFSIELGGNDQLSGRVIANTPGRDVAVTWEEDAGSVLCFRTLPLPRTLGQRLIVLSWSRWSDEAPEESRLEKLDAAHHRLTRALGMSSEA
jgi:uncharacterized protein YndB with AHSA1/START domain